MISFTQDIVLSLSDLGTAIKKEAKRILMVAGSLGLLCFLWRLQTSPSYTAKGIVKEGKLEKGDSLSLPREILLLSDKKSNEDPLEIISSPPVMERVIKRLNLQGVVSSPQGRKGRLTRMGRALKMGWAHYYYQRVRRPSSPFLSKANVIPDKILFKDPPPCLLCQEIVYRQKIFTSLWIKIFSETEYEVLDASKKSLGRGVFGVPFVFEKGNFILRKGEGFSLGKKIHKLTLLPLEPLTEGLKKKISIKRDRNNSSLLTVTHTNSKRELAAEIVNATMEEFKNYLKNDSEIKTTSQLNYLKKRKDESSQELDEVIDDQKHFFIDNLAEGGFITSENEMEFLFSSQAYLKQESQTHSREIMRIDQLLQGRERPFNDILAELKNKGEASAPELEKIDLSTAQALYQEYIQNLSALDLKSEKIEALLENINSNSLSSFSVSINDPYLNDLFTKAQRLSQNLQDANYTSKERERMAEEAETLSNFLKTHLTKQKSVLAIEQNLLQDKIDRLSAHTLKKHFEEYERLDNALQILAQKTSSFPDKWIAEQKINYNTSLCSEVVLSIAKMIETKNIAYHLEYINSGPFVYAYPPPLPNNPRLIFHTIVGLCLGLLGYIFFLTLTILFKGPSASYSNLVWAGCTVEQITESTATVSLQRASSYFFKHHCRTLLFYSAQQTPLFSSLLSILLQRKKRIALLDFKEQANEEGTFLHSFLLGNSDFPSLPETELFSAKIGMALSDIYEPIILERLIQNLKKKYDIVIFQIAGEIQCCDALLPLIQGTACLLSTESFHEITPLLQGENKAFFFLRSSPSDSLLKKLSLKNLEPLLTRLNENLKKWRAVAMKKMTP